MNQINPHILRMADKSWNDLRSPLLKYSKNKFSQAGEDGIISEILRLVPELPKSFVEFGAWDGIHLSNCARLVQEEEWAGVFIEGLESRYQELVANYNRIENAFLLNNWVEPSGANSLDNLLKKTPVRNVGLLSIDIDGNDYHVWESLALRPSLVIIEINPSIPNDVEFVQERKLGVNQGSSLLSMQKLAKKKGYELIVCTSLNAFFIDEVFFNRFSIDNKNLDELYVPKTNGRIFHGYDGTVFVVGMDRIIWKQKNVSSVDFQVLPESERIF
jgi:hypothetical protein